MDIRQLRYFTRIVELESITAAADALHIAQPSLSQQVAKLESELDTKLLVRGPAGVQPTHTGSILYRHAKMVIRQMDEARAAVEHGRDIPSGHVSIGLPTSTSRVLALPLIEAVAQHLPQVTFELVEGSSLGLAESVATQRLELAIAMNVQPQPRMHVVPLLEEQLMLVGQALPGQDAVTLAEVAALPLLLPSFPNSVRVTVDRAFADAALPLRLVAETSAVSILLSSVQRGHGWTILPWSALAGAEHLNPPIVGTPIADRELKRRISLCMSTSAQSSLACMAVQRLTFELVRDMAQDGRWKGVTWLGG